MENDNMNNEEYNSQIDEKQQEKQATKKLGKTAAKAIAGVYTGGKSLEAENIPVAGKVVDKAFDVAGSAVGKAADVATFGKFSKTAKKLDDNNIIDAADQVIGTVGKANNIMSKNVAGKSTPATESFANRKSQITPAASINPQKDIKDISDEMSKSEVEELKNEVDNKNIPVDEKPKEVSGEFSFNIPKVVIAVIGIGVLVFVFLLFIYMLISRMDLVGKKYSDYDELDYVANTSDYCTDIILVKETDSYTGPTISNIDEIDLNETVKVNNQTINRWETNSYTLENYVKGVLQAETINIADDKTFEVASIVARTYSLQIASENCRIWDNTNKNGSYRNPQNFTPDTPDGKISTAVGLTSGIVIMEKENLLDLSQNNYYDYMCFEKIKEDDNNNKNYEVIQDIVDGRLLPTDWVLENVNINDYNKSGKYDGQCQKNGLSLYSSKYLLNTKADKYTPMRVIKYFYGYDKELKKVSRPMTFSCGGFNLHGTTLTREEFINFVNSYNGGAKYSNLAAIAGEIYDISIANGFNPELVITRAISEGFSGGNNNYWGIGASNGTSGYNYSSLSEGVLAYINTMSKYKNANTLYDVFNNYHYAFIGSNWFSPGGPGKGGCYYLPYIEKYYTNQARLAEAKASCASGSQIATNDEDQSAYSMWQVEQMNDHRSKVFGITSDCNFGDINSILNSDASIGQKAAQLAVMMFDSFGYSKPNRWGSNQVDCSSLVYRTYEQLGINFGGVSTSSEELKWCKANNRMISANQLQPGDLLFNNHHVEIYIGNGQRFGAHDDSVPWDDQVSIKNFENNGYFTEFCRPY